MKLFAGFLAAALAQEEGSDRWGYYDYYVDSSVGKSQNSQSHGLGPLMTNRAEGIMGNGRICWQCQERSYGHCLASNPTNGDVHRHGAAYCQGEDYFCYINERRIIRHDGNDYNFEFGQPWSSNGANTYQEENIDHATSNSNQNTNIRVDMGCQQPMACLRQQNMNYKIDMGLPFHTMSSVPIDTYPVAKYPGLVREGSCRLGKDWLDYASGVHDSDNWRLLNWRSINIDRRFGAVEHHYHYGKGTESNCHYCCDPLLEFSDADSNPATPYDYFGCNYNAVAAGQLTISSGGTVDGAGNVAANVFINRHQDWTVPVWYDNRQYHGMFRNPHTQFPRKTMTYNFGSEPNGRR